MSNWWLKWHEIASRCDEREIVFYGRSEDWIPKALKNVSPKTIVDNNELYEGTTYRDILYVTQNLGSTIRHHDRLLSSRQASSTE